MVWYRELYVGEQAKKDKQKIIWKVKHGAGMTDVYLIALASNGTDLLDIFHSAVLLQKPYRRYRSPFIIGIARGYEEAVEVAAIILADVYRNTGTFRVREYVGSKQKKQKF